MQVTVQKKLHDTNFKTNQKYVNRGQFLYHQIQYQPPKKKKKKSL